MRYLYLFIALSMGLFAQAQTDGLSYQAVIINDSPQEIPGMDVSGNVLSDAAVEFRFSIWDENDQLLFQETQTDTTDRYGLVETVIGQGELTAESPSAFDGIFWNGRPMDLEVEISTGGGELNSFSRQALLFVPYAYHRDVIATEDLSVDGNSTLDGTLDVGGNSTLNGDLSVVGGGFSNLSGALGVDGAATFYSDADVLGTLEVAGTSQLNGQVTIDASLSGGESDYDAYPLRVQGSTHGIAIQSNSAVPDEQVNFITFFDGNGNAIGSIEGQTAEDVATNPQYLFETAVLAAETANAAAAAIGAGTSSTVCAGIGTCITAPIPSLGVAAAVNVATATANLALYQVFAFDNLGVTYESGSADYAEWLERSNHEEMMSYGDIVAVNGGRISKDSRIAEDYMVISFKPAMLGNMPDEAEADEYEMVAFMGQVPVKVLGEVEVGDYILPSGRSDGFGIGKSATEMDISDYRKVIGTAWSSSNDPISSYVNVAIGLGDQGLLDALDRQEARISKLEEDMADIRASLGLSSPIEDVAESKDAFGDENPYQYPIIDYTEVETALEWYAELMLEQGIDVYSHPLLGKVFNDPVQRAMLVEQVKEMSRSGIDMGRAFDGTGK